MSLFSWIKEQALGVIDPYGISADVTSAGSRLGDRVSFAIQAKGLDPDVRDGAKLLIDSWNDAFQTDTGASAFLAEGKRSLARQKKLVEAGRSETLASKHLEGLAVDIWFYDEENNRPITPDDTPPDWYEALGQIGEDIGFTWGGRWLTLVDKPHFEV